MCKCSCLSKPTLERCAKVCKTMQNCAELCKSVQNYAKLCKTVQNWCKTVQLDRVCKTDAGENEPFLEKMFDDAGEGERRRTEVRKDNRMQKICTSVHAKKVCTSVHAKSLHPGSCKKCKILNYFRNAGGMGICILCLFRVAGLCMFEH